MTEDKGDGVALGNAAPHGRDDAVGDARAQPERVSEGEHEVADVDPRRVRERGRARSRPRHANHGDVVRGIAADGRRGMAVARGQGHDELRRVRDDVCVGDDVATGVDDHAGAEVLRCPDLHD